MISSRLLQLNSFFSQNFFVDISNKTTSDAVDFHGFSSFFPEVSVQTSEFSIFSFWRICLFFEVSRKIMSFNFSVFTFQILMNLFIFGIFPENFVFSLFGEFVYFLKFPGKFRVELELSQCFTAASTRQLLSSVISLRSDEMKTNKFCRSCWKLKATGLELEVLDSWHLCILRKPKTWRTILLIRT